MPYLPSLQTACLAQSVERIHGKDEVAGSIPVTGIRHYAETTFLLTQFLLAASTRSPDFSNEKSALLRPARRHDKTIPQDDPSSLSNTTSNHHVNTPPIDKGTCHHRPTQRPVGVLRATRSLTLTALFLLTQKTHGLTLPARVCWR